MMLSVKKIDPPGWMTDEKCSALMRVLGGYESVPEALFVGGCIRNTLLDKPVRDIDIATIHHPLEVLEKLKIAGIRYVPTGLEHGTVTAIIEDATFEITTLRKDIETDGRHAVISFTKEWDVDAKRRDFTMNTLLASVEGEVFDPVGTGIEDLEARRIIFVGNPSERIAEDYLRILRFFRFYAEYGRGDPDVSALKACREYAEKISSLSRERITQEFFKILAVPHANDILDMMFRHHVLKGIAKSYNSSVMDSLCQLQEKFECVNLMSRLLALSGMTPDYFDEWLVLSNTQKKNLEGLSLGLGILKPVSMKKMRELIYKVGNGKALQVYLLKLCQKGDWPDMEIIDIVKYWQAPEFPVKGADLIAAGTLPGPELGKKLKAMEEKWVADDFAKVPKY